MKVRFLADANFNQRIVSGLLLKEPAFDFALPQVMIPDGMQDLDVLRIAQSAGRIVVSHDVRTMPYWFERCIEEGNSSGLILVPVYVPIRKAIEDLLLVWQLTDASEWMNRIEWLPM